MIASISLSSLVPNVEDLLALEVEELAGVLLVHFNSRLDPEEDLNHHNFFIHLYQVPEYSMRQKEVYDALLEAWAWLTSEGFLARRPDPTSGAFFVTRRGKRLQSREAFREYQKAHLFPKGRLHPVIASKVYPAFLRGEYDTAIFQAFREVEIAVRTAGGFFETDYGIPLMRKAFCANPQGPLTDKSLPTPEQEAMAHLFSGAIGLYKNPQSHRNVPTQPIDASEVIVFASQLLRIVDRIKP